MSFDCRNSKDAEASTEQQPFSRVVSFVVVVWPYVNVSCAEKPKPSLKAGPAPTLYFILKPISAALFHVTDCEFDLTCVWVTPQLLSSGEQQFERSDSQEASTLTGPSG